MRRKVILHGSLIEAAGGLAEWILDVATVGEAVRAIDAQRQGFMKVILDHWREGIHFAVIAGDESFSEKDILEGHPLGMRETLEFVPLIGGAGSGTPWWMIVVGVVLIVAATALGPYGWGFFVAGSIGAFALGVVAAIGVSLVLSGVSSLIAGTPATPFGDKGLAENANNIPSYFFSGQVNLTGYGQPVSIGYGRMIIGSRRISTGIFSERTGDN